MNEHDSARSEALRFFLRKHYLPEYRYIRAIHEDAVTSGAEAIEIAPETMRFFINGKWEDRPSMPRRARRTVCPIIVLLYGPFHRTSAGIESTPALHETIDRSPLRWVLNDIKAFAEPDPESHPDESEG